MVVNAGRTKHKAALDFTTEEIEQLWNINVCSFDFEIPDGRVADYGLALWNILLRASGGESVHKARREGVDSLYSFDGLV